MDHGRSISFSPSRLSLKFALFKAIDLLDNTTFGQGVVSEVRRL